MKVITILALVFLAGCTTYPPLEQLEAEALVTGDWAAVEKRERVIAWRQQRQGIQGPGQQINFCQKSVGTTRCECVEQDELRLFLEGF